MAVGLTECAELLSVPGIRLGTTSAGVGKEGRSDLVVMELAPGVRSAAMFTRNAFCAAPVVVARNHVSECVPRYLIINSGNANAGTGQRGIDDALTTCQLLADLARCDVREVLPFSTGVIGEPLKMDAFRIGIPKALAALNDTGWIDAARGIMTTDTVAKGVSRRVPVGGESVTITGIAKGAGMIHPDMATMLAFIATDAQIAPQLLPGCLRDAVAASFNCITVDGDTSTNDACVLMATGQSGAPAITLPDGEVYQTFVDALTRVCTELAQAIVRDGEGATRFIAIEVEEGASTEECRLVADAIARSPLVKTAFFAGDPNWGRILAAVGRAGIEDLEISGVSIFLDEACIVRHGARAVDYTEEQGLTVMRRDEITVRIGLGRGSHHARVWTCDLSYDYVRINAEYRT